jgi:hypothetical protein
MSQEDKLQCKQFTETLRAHNSITDIEAIEIKAQGNKYP